ncbi:lactate racemase domain-containing protein [Feifania hominis]|uniref:DUF2088 domain-containing protein n=1 Tax=Feifania hominis TaxID=2763660 RepID=A0A926DBR6_9FIRM|nr:lactate racemase domain-containing protein [Feifania hominis]MBC8536050.1 DUF2088 domain-containing protein [Feifania hominis]
MDICLIAKTGSGLSAAAIEDALLQSLRGRSLSHVLIIPPDITRRHSNAGLITNLLYHHLTQSGCEVDIMPALGTHTPMTAAEMDEMYGDIPHERFLVHNWRTDVCKVGSVPSSFVSEISEGLCSGDIAVEINRRLLDAKYELILSVGQVVPHEIVGMANHSKNLFVGVGGSEMINKSHILGAVYGMERIMGRDRTPVRRLFDYALEHCLDSLPVCYILTVCTADGDDIHTHGLFIGEGRGVFESAVALAEQKNIIFVEHGIKKCVVYLDPGEFHSTWLGNKSVYRTRMAIADGGELLVLAPGVRQFGEDAENDRLIRKYGYCGRERILKQMENSDLSENLSAAAHLIHGSSDGRFHITYAVQNITRREVESVGYGSADYNETVQRYDPAALTYGFNTLPDGEEIFYIPNPALGLWINREAF